MKNVSINKSIQSIFVDFVNHDKRTLARCEHKKALQKFASAYENHKNLFLLS